MAIKTLTRSIDGFDVSISQLPGMASLKMSARLGKLFGAPLSRALSSIDVAQIGASDVVTIGAALLTLFDGLSEDALEKLARDLLATATLNGAPFFPACDLLLAGHVDSFYKILGFALEVNYGGFIDVLRALGVKAKAAQHGKDEAHASS